MALRMLKPTLRQAPPLVRPLVVEKVADPFYLSPAWRRLVSDVKLERGNRCEDCGAQGVRIHGDHVIERKDGGADLDRRNVRLRCSKCHGKKTAKARREREQRT